MYIFVNTPDKNGVYKIGERFINLIQYKKPNELEFATFLCPACSAHQVNNFYKCVLCGFDAKTTRSKDIPAFIEENKEKIKEIKENYGR